MVCGFDFNIDTAVADCREWLASDPDTELEYIETQRASLNNMMRLDTTLNDEQHAIIKQIEKLLYDYLVEHGAVSSPVLREDAQGGDLLHLPLDNTALTTGGNNDGSQR